MSKSMEKQYKNTSDGVLDEPLLPSSLAAARAIGDITSIKYPEGIKSPQLDLNPNARQGRFRYDRAFLLQFMTLCTERPDRLTSLDALGLEPPNQDSTPVPHGYAGHRQALTRETPPPTPRPGGAVSLGISFTQRPGFAMGQFATPKSSEERFAAAMRFSSTSSARGSAGMPFGRPCSMVHPSVPRDIPKESDRTRTKHGGKRNNAQAPLQPYALHDNDAAQAVLAPPAPPIPSASRWQPNIRSRTSAVALHASPEVVERKVRALLNKLTTKTFGSISDQIVTWANRSEKESDGRTLSRVVKLVFEHATHNAMLSEIFARLCRRMMEQISPRIRDDGVRNAEGKHITGGLLFRKRLLGSCGDGFDRKWAPNGSTAATSSAEVEEADTKKAAEKIKDIALFSDDDYAAQKAKRRSLGVTKLVGELFKLQMLSERGVHESVKRLIGDTPFSDAERPENLCMLLTTTGAVLDSTPKARARMDVYFSRMQEHVKNENVTSRMRFMLQDVLELRARKWVARKQRADPKAIITVHAWAVAKDRQLTDSDILRLSKVLYLGP